MIPLWTSATRPSLPRCGCALTSLGAPWVAQRVCPMPVVEGGQRLVGERLLEVGELAGALAPRDGRRRDDERDPGGVVAAVLQPAQALDDDVLSLLVPDVPHDAAHGPRVYRRRCTGARSPVAGLTDRAPTGRLPVDWNNARHAQRCAGDASRPRTSSSTVTPGPSWARTSTSRSRGEEIARLRGLGDQLDLEEVAAGLPPALAAAQPARRRPPAACTASRRSSCTGRSRRARRS